MQRLFENFLWSVVVFCYFQVGIIYSATRVFVNLTQVYMPLYLEDTLRLQSSSVASIPLVVFGVGFLTATVMQVINRKIGRKITFLLGCGMGEHEK